MYNQSYRYSHRSNSSGDDLGARNSIRSIPVEISHNFPAEYSTNIPVEIENIRRSTGNCKFLPPIALDKYKLNDDPNPEIIRKKPSDKIRYTQDVTVRYLEPPEVQKPGDIVIKQLPNRQIAPAPPLIVRQAPPRPVTPAPLVIRELPPQAPSRIEDKLILVPGKVLPPPARKVVIERLPAIPSKPQQIFIEKWMPFKKQKRRVIFQKAEADCILPNPRNLIIQWDQPEVEVKRNYKKLGIERADPEEYVRRHGHDLLRHDEFFSKIKSIGAPDSLIQIESHFDQGLPDLEGDLEALKLIDLERSGLGEYRSFLSNLGIRSVSISAGEFGLVTASNLDNLISVEHAREIADDLESAEEKLITDSELRTYFNSLDSNGDTRFDYEEFREVIN